MSNYLLWQISYAEIAVVDEQWPDFTRERFFELICDFAGRSRRFGNIDSQ